MNRILFSSVFVPRKAYRVALIEDLLGVTELCKILPSCVDLAGWLS